MVGKEWKILVSAMKDRASLMKATVSSKRSVSKIKKAVIRATNRTSINSPPPEYRVDIVLNLGRESARPCVEAIMDRLHGTGTAGNPYVALKCLILIHHLIARGSFVLKDQLSIFFFPPLNHDVQKSLNLTVRRTKSNVLAVETWELSKWVRWYAAVLEHNLITSKVLGLYLSSSSSYNSKLRDHNNTGSSSDNFLREMDSLVSMVEGICAAPESLHYQRMDLVHELMLLVSEDYRSTQRQIMLRLEEFGDSEENMDRLSSNDSVELISCLERLETCLPRLIEMFANRKRNDEFWELISQLKIRLEIMNERKEKKKLVVVWKDEVNSGGMDEFSERNESSIKSLWY